MFNALRLTLYDIPVLCTLKLFLLKLVCVWFRCIAGFPLSPSRVYLTQLLYPFALLKIVIVYILNII